MVGSSCDRMRATNNAWRNKIFKQHSIVITVKTIAYKTTTVTDFSSNKILLKILKDIFTDFDNSYWMILRMRIYCNIFFADAIMKCLPFKCIYNGYHSQYSNNVIDTTCIKTINIETIPWPLVLFGFLLQNSGQNCVNRLEKRKSNFVPTIIGAFIH